MGRSLGILNADCTIAHTRAGAGTITYADCYNMVSKIKMGGGLVWLGSQTIIPALAAMVDAGSHAVWTGGNLG